MERRSDEICYLYTNLGQMKPLLGPWNFGQMVSFICTWNIGLMITCIGTWNVRQLIQVIGTGILRQMLNCYWYKKPQPKSANDPFYR